MTIRSFIIVSAPMPILVELLLTPYWFGRHFGPNGMPTWVAPTQMLITGLLIPAYLGIIGIISIVNAKPTNLPAKLLILVLMLMIANCTHYAIWGFSTGNLLNPDTETEIVVEAIVMLGAIVLAVLLLSAMAVRLVLSFKRTS